MPYIYLDGYFQHIDRRYGYIFYCHRLPSHVGVISIGSCKSCFLPFRCKYIAYLYMHIVTGSCLTDHDLEVVAGDDFLPVLHPADGRRWAPCHGTLQLDVGRLVGIRVGRVVQELRRHCRNTQNDTTYKQQRSAWTCLSETLNQFQCCYCKCCSVSSFSTFIYFPLRIVFSH